MDEVTRRQFLVGAGSSALAYALGSRQALGQSLTSLEQLIKKKFSQQSHLTLHYPKGCKDNLLQIIRYFNTLTSCQIHLVEGSLDDIAADLILKERLKEQKKPIDISLPATFALPDLAEGNVIVPLDDYAKVYEPQIGYTPSLFPLGDRYKGKLYGYQTDGDTYVLFLNKARLISPRERNAYSQKYNKKLDVPKTWQELDQQIQFFHRPKKEEYGGSLFRNKDYAGWEFWSRLHSKGLYPVDDNFVPRFLTTQAEEALSEMAATTRYLCPNVRDAGLFENFKMYAEGNIYCNLGWGGTQKYLNKSNSQIKDLMYHAPLPGGSFNGVDVTMPYFNWGWNFVVSKSSLNPELAYLFCLFATTATASIKSVQEEGGYFDPFRVEHYNDTKVIRAYGEEFLQNHKNCMENSIPDFYFQGAGPYLNSLRRSVYAASNDLIPIKYALKKMQREWEELTEKIGREKQKRQWTFLKALYPKDIAKVLR